jgi:hypothetical protein
VNRPPILLGTPSFTATGWEGVAERVTDAQETTRTSGNAGRQHYARADATVEPAEAALSFLKDTKSALSWSARDLADTLKIGRRDAEQVLALLAAQGYAQPASGTDEWMTTPSGESVSGTKAPRFKGENVEQAVESLEERIKQINNDSKARYTREALRIEPITSLPGLRVVRILDSLRERRGTPTAIQETTERSSPAALWISGRISIRWRCTSSSAATSLRVSQQAVDQ